MDDIFSRVFQRDQDDAIEARVSGLRYAEVDSLDEDSGGYILRWLTGNVDEPSAPARVASFMAGRERGAYFMPEPGDEVVVGFEQGDFERPVILGALWSSETDPVPANVDTSADNNIRTIVSRSGHQLNFDDTPGSEKVTLQSANNKLKVVLDDANGKIIIEVDANNRMEMDASGVTLKGTQVTIEANGSNKINISSSGVDIDGTKIELN